jgi:aryl carrier-like protein
MTKEQLRELIASYVDEEIDSIADNDNLVYEGVDSMMMMSIVEELRTRGILVNFLELSEQPTIEAWFEKIHVHTTA